MYCHFFYLLSFFAKSCGPVSIPINLIRGPKFCSWLKSVSLIVLYKESYLFLPFLYSKILLHETEM